MPKVVGKDETVAKRITCRGCGSINEYYKNEVHKYNGRDYTGGADGREWIICAECGKEVIIRSW